MRTGLLFICLFVPLAAGCLRLERDYPERNFFTLEAGRPEGAAPGPVYEALRVEKIRVSSPFQGKNFLYRTSGLQYEEDFYNRFFAAPGDLITGETVRWLTASGLFSEVYGRAAPVVPDNFLEGTVSALYGDFRASPPTAVLEVGFSLAQEENGRPGILLRRSYRREIPLEQKTPAALAAGWSEALAQILAELEQDLRGKAE